MEPNKYKKNSVAKQEKTEYVGDPKSKSEGKHIYSNPELRWIKILKNDIEFDLNHFIQF